MCGVVHVASVISKVVFVLVCSIAVVMVTATSSCLVCCILLLLCCKEIVPSYAVQAPLPYDCI